jgi:uncharacterized membrane protein
MLDRSAKPAMVYHIALEGREWMSDPTINTNIIQIGLLSDGKDVRFSAR